MQRAAQAGLLTSHTVTTVLLVGINSGYSALVVAHELVHRGGGIGRGIGRVIFASVLYEHFYTEHLRGHHTQFGRTADPGTSRFGESLFAFMCRSIPGQFKSAWKLEAERLGGSDGSVRDLRWLRSGVVQGLAGEIALFAGVIFVFGLTGGVVFLGQAGQADQGHPDGGQKTQESHSRPLGVTPQSCLCTVFQGRMRHEWARILADLQGRCAGVAEI